MNTYSFLSSHIHKPLETQVQSPGSESENVLAPPLVTTFLRVSDHSDRRDYMRPVMSVRDLRPVRVSGHSESGDAILCTSAAAETPELLEYGSSVITVIAESNMNSEMAKVRPLEARYVCELKTSCKCL